MLRSRGSAPTAGDDDSDDDVDFELEELPDTDEVEDADASSEGAAAYEPEDGLLDAWDGGSFASASAAGCDEAMPQVECRETRKRRRVGDLRASPATAPELRAAHPNGARALPRRRGRGAAAAATAASSWADAASRASGAHDTAGAATASGAVTGDDDGPETGVDAICLRTRSKHPLGVDEYDPELCDRLLAALDPDVDGYAADDAYREFLQSILADPPAASADALAAAGAAPQHDGTGPAVGSAPAAPCYMDDDDDDDDPECDLSGLEGWLDDERDAAEEELLAQLVRLAPQQQVAARRTTSSIGERGGTRRGRTQRQAARRAAERIAAEQQLRSTAAAAAAAAAAAGHSLGAVPPSSAAAGLAVPSELVPAGAEGPGTTSLPPLIPTTAAGQAATMPHPQQQQPELLAPQLPQWAPPPVASALHGGQHDGLGGPLLLHAADIQQQQQQEEEAHAALTVAGALALSDGQLRQLHHQVSLHAQLLLQLYVLTARDSSCRRAQAVATAAGGMLGQLQALHAAALATDATGHLPQLLAEAFAAAAPAGTVHHQQQEQEQTSGRQRQRSRRPWHPAELHCTTLWDCGPLRALPAVINRMRLLPQLNTPLLLHLKASRGGNTGRRTAARADELLMYAAGMERSLLCADVSAWPRYSLAPRRQGSWTPGEDALMWLGTVRFHSAVRSLSHCATCISEELLPTRTSRGIVSRFRNAVLRRDAMAQVILSHALIGSEQPGAWDSATEGSDGEVSVSSGDSGGDSGSDSGGAHGSDNGSDCDNGGEMQMQAQGGSSRRRQRRGPQWVAGELGAALTAAFAAVHASAGPSAAAAAAAGVLLLGGTTTGGGAGSALQLQASQPPPPALASAAQRLIDDFVAHVAPRLSVCPPAPLSAPAAASMRRTLSWQWGRGGSRAAGDQLLLSLAARQLLAGDTAVAGGHDGHKGPATAPGAHDAGGGGAGGAGGGAGNGAAAAAGAPALACVPYPDGAGADRGRPPQPAAADSVMRQQPLCAAPADLQSFTALLQSPPPSQQQQRQQQRQQQQQQQQHDHPPQPQQHEQQQQRHPPTSNTRRRTSLPAATPVGGKRPSAGRQHLAPAPGSCGSALDAANSADQGLLVPPRAPLAAPPPRPQESGREDMSFGSSAGVVTVDSAGCALDEAPATDVTSKQMQLPQSCPQEEMLLQQEQQEQLHAPVHERAAADAIAANLELAAPPAAAGRAATTLGKQLRRSLFGSSLAAPGGRQPAGAGRGRPGAAGGASNTDGADDAGLGAASGSAVRGTTIACIGLGPVEDSGDAVDAALPHQQQQQQHVLLQRSPQLAVGKRQQRSPQGALQGGVSAAAARRFREIAAASEAVTSSATDAAAAQPSVSRLHPSLLLQLQHQPHAAATAQQHARQQPLRGKGKCKAPLQQMRGCTAPLWPAGAASTGAEDTLQTSLLPSSSPALLLMQQKQQQRPPVQQLPSSAVIDMNGSLPPSHRPALMQPLSLSAGQLVMMTQQQQQQRQQQHVGHDAHRAPQIHAGAASALQTGQLYAVAGGVSLSPLQALAEAAATAQHSAAAGNANRSR